MYQCPALPVGLLEEDAAAPILLHVREVEHPNDEPREQARGRELELDAPPHLRKYHDISLDISPESREID